MTRMLTTLAAALLAAGPLAAQETATTPAPAQEMTIDTVVATVNGTEITLGHMLTVRAGLPEQYQQLPADVLWDGILDQLVQQEALSQDERAAETPSVRFALDNERRALLASGVVGQIAADAVSDEAVQAAYEADYAGAEQGMEYNAAHILVETEEEAKAIAEQVRGGADFATVAEEKSTGPSGPNGGALGWFGPGMMVEPFQLAVEAMEVGAISDPVQTQFGWHVIKLLETRTQEAPALDAVRAEIEANLQRAAVTAHIESLVAGADVTRTDKADIDPAILSNLGLLEE